MDSREREREREEEKERESERKREGEGEVYQAEVVCSRRMESFIGSFIFESLYP